MSFTLHGLAVSQGIAIGRAHLILRGMTEVPQYNIIADELAAETTRFDNAIKAGRRPPFSSHKRQAAMPAVTMTGCVLTVWVSVSAGPSATIAHRSSPRVAEASSKVARTTAASP